MRVEESDTPVARKIERDGLRCVVGEKDALGTWSIEPSGAIPTWKASARHQCALT